MGRKTFGIATLFVIIAALALLCPIGAFAATSADAPPTPEFPPWLTYAIAVLFNWGIVAGIRSKIKNAAVTYLSQSGRVTTVLVFIIAGLLRFIAGKFGALDDSESFMRFLAETSALAYSTLGAHTIGKSLKEAGKVLNLVLIFSLTLFIVPAAFCQTITTQTLTVAPAVRSSGTTPITEIETTFQATVFWDNTKYGIAPIRTELWRDKKLHVALFGLIKPVDKVQVGTETAIGYDIYYSKPFRKLFRNDKITVVFTPYWGLSQDITPNEMQRIVTKPFPGVRLLVSWE